MKKRKVTALVMATMMILSMTACGNGTSSASENSDASDASGASIESNVQIQQKHLILRDSPWSLVYGEAHGKRHLTKRV